MPPLYVIISTFYFKYLTRARLAIFTLPNHNKVTFLANVLLNFSSLTLKVMSRTPRFRVDNIIFISVFFAKATGLAIKNVLFGQFYSFHITVNIPDDFSSPLQSSSMNFNVKISYLKCFSPAWIWFFMRYTSRKIELL